MSNFKIINHPSEIKISKNWIDSKNFDPEVIVNKKGKQVSANYNGHKYRIIAKHERFFSSFEKFGKRFLGVLILIATLGYTYFKSEYVQNLFKKKEIVYFGALISKDLDKIIPNPIAAQNPIVKFPEATNETGVYQDLKTIGYKKEENSKEVNNLKGEDKEIGHKSDGKQVPIDKPVNFDEKPVENVPQNLKPALPGFQIFISPLGKMLFTIRVQSSDTILDIKKQIESIKGIPIDQQKILWAGKQLEDGRTVADYNLLNETTIHMITNLRGD